MKRSNNAQTQRAILLNHLQEFGRINTVDARQKLDIMHPAARIQELRENGNNIVTYKRHVDNHKKVAEYVLLPS
jgi:hypothetical protein